MVAVKKRQKYSSDKLKYKVAYFYIAPFFILYSIFGLFPLVSGFIISFFRWDGISDMLFIGLDNYINLLKHNLFHTALFNTLFIGIFTNIPILMGGMILAYILNLNLVRYKNVFKTIYFIPMVTSSVAITIIFQNLFGFNFGMINYLLRILGEENVNWLGGDGSLIKVAVIIMFVWKWTGWNMVIYLAGMQGISNDIYEAALIDGANHLNTLLRITIPLLKPIVFFTMVQSLIGTFNVFTEPFVLLGSDWQGGINNGGLTIMMYLLYQAPQGGTAYGYASACAYLITVMIVIITIIMNRAMVEREPKKKHAL